MKTNYSVGTVNGPCSVHKRTIVCSPQPLKSNIHSITESFVISIGGMTVPESTGPPRPQEETDGKEDVEVPSCIGGNQRQRLVIKEMVLENFKSYAGAQRVGPFHKVRSLVVGWNPLGRREFCTRLILIVGIVEFFICCWS